MEEEEDHPSAMEEEDQQLQLGLLKLCKFRTQCMSCLALQGQAPPSPILSSPTHLSTSAMVKVGGGTLRPNPSLCSTRRGVLKPCCSKKSTVTSEPWRRTTTSSALCGDTSDKDESCVPVRELHVVCVP